MTESRNLICSATIVLLSSACDGGSVYTATEVVDSAGVTIVYNGVGPDRSSHQWIVATSPRMSIGTAEGDPEDMLYSVSGAILLPNGHTVIASSGSKTIRVFDASGTFVREFGGEGKGPGEFVVPTQTVFVEPDTIVVLDYPLRRLTWFTIQGDLTRTESIDAQQLTKAVEPLSMVTTQLQLLADGDLLVVTYEPGGHEKYGDDPFRPLHGWLRMSRDFADVDTLGFYRDIEQMYVTAVGFPTAANRPYGKQAVWSLNGQPSRVCIGEQTEPRVDCFESQRRLSFRWVQESHRITDADMAAWEQRTRESFGHLTDEQVNRMIDQLTHGQFMPAYGAIFVDKLRHTWVASGPAETPSRRGQFRVFDTEGRMVAYASVPDLKIMEIGSDYIIGVRTDENDVEFVEAYSLERTPSGS